MAIFHAGLQSALDDDGLPIEGAEWLFYETGTSTPAAVYADAALTDPHGVSVEADAAGRFPTVYFGEGLFRAVLKDALGATIKDIDPANDAASSTSSGSAFPVGLFTDIGDWTIPDDVNLIQTSGFDTQGIGAARYVVGSASDDANDETVTTTNTANDRPATLAEDTPTLKMFGSTGNNLAPDMARNQEGLDNLKIGSTVRATMGAVGGAYKTTGASLNITKPINLESDWGVMFRADNAAGETFPALSINPTENLAGGFYATIQGYFSGTNLIITTNTAGKILFGGSGLSAPGLASGTALQLAPPADVLANATGTYAVTVNNVATTQNLGSSGSPLTIKVIVNEARGMRISGGAFISNALAGTSGYGIAIGNADDNECFSMIGTTIENVAATGGLGGIYIEGGLGRENLWTSVIRSTIEGATIAHGSDGIQFRDCIISGTTSWDLVEGAFHDGIFSGTAVTRDGIADVQNGSRMKFHDVQVEQSGISQQTPYKTQFMFRSFDYANVGSEVIGCNLGGGLYNEVHAALYNTRGLVWDRNYMNVTYIDTGGGTYGDAWDIFLDRDTTNDGGSSLPYLTAHNYNTAYIGSQDAYDTIFGYYNRYRGARARQTTAQYTDVSRLLRVLTPNSPNNKIRMPHRGLWMPVADIATLGSGFTVHGSDGCQLMIEHSGRIAGLGGLAIGGNVSRDAVVMTLPEWMRPFKDAYATAVLVGGIGVDDIVAVLKVEAATGAVSIGQDVTVANHANLRFDSFSYMAVTDPYPTVGP